jgi:hypothetical protein
VSTLNYQDTYSRMGNDELLRLASQWDTLTESAQAAVTTELETRNLKKELRAEVQAAAQKPASEPPSQPEKVMFALFIVGLPSSFLLPRVWPESMQVGGLYGLIHGLSSCFPLWMVVWVVLRARRIQRIK